MKDPLKVLEKVGFKQTGITDNTATFERHVTISEGEVKCTYLQRVDLIRCAWDGALRLFVCCINEEDSDENGDEYPDQVGLTAEDLAAFDGSYPYPTYNPLLNKIQEE